MRLLLCSPTRLTRELGASKAPMELAGALRGRGWDVDVVGPETYAPHADGRQGIDRFLHLSRGLNSYLGHYARQYDVVDFDHELLPYPRQEGSATTLLVARTPLLALYLDNDPVPRPPLTLRRLAGKILRDPVRRRVRRHRVKSTWSTVQEADLVIVNNVHDKDELVRWGLGSERIAVTGLGMSRDRMDAFANASSAPRSTPVVPFVGTFDYRKGALDLPTVVDAVAGHIPGVQFRLLGTRGMFRTEQEVRAHFPPALQSRIEVVPRYRPESLPQLLSGCSAGVFPSYLEGFGFGVLEMLAASLPVVAYDVPGPPMMLPAEWLVPAGDTPALASKLVHLLSDEDRLTRARTAAQRRAEAFTWDAAAKQTEDAYETGLRRLSNPPATTEPLVVA